MLHHEVDIKLHNYEVGTKLHSRGGLKAHYINMTHSDYNIYTFLKDCGVLDV